MTFEGLGPDQGENPSRGVQQWDPVSGEPEHVAAVPSNPEPAATPERGGPDSSVADVSVADVSVADVSEADVSVAGGRPVWSWPDTPAAGSTTFLPATAAAHGAAAPQNTPGTLPVASADATTTIDTRHYARQRRLERRVMVLSTLLGTLGLAVAFAAAGLDQLRYNLPGPCATYGTAHKGQSGFGCSATAKHVAVLLPAVGITLLVLVALAAVWIPQRSPKGRLLWLAGYVVLLVLAAVAVAVAYSALPQNG